MEDLTKLTPTELLKRGNDIKAKHDALKEEIISNSFEIEEFEKKVQEKLILLDELEREYVEIVEVISK